MSEWTHTLDGVRCRLASNPTTMIGFTAVKWENGLSSFERIPDATWARAIPTPRPVVRPITWLPIKDPMTWRAPADCWVAGGGEHAKLRRGEFCAKTRTHYALIEGTLP